MTTPALELRRIEKSFSGVKVLKEVDLVLPARGAILGLVGENGAGKSTMMNVLGGVHRRDGGELLLDGLPYDPGSPTDADRAGIAVIHQELNLFLNMTVAENLFLTGAPGTRFHLLSYRAMNRAAREQLARVGLDLHPATPVAELSMGVRQLVEIAKALSREARIVVFDEPTTSLATHEKERLFRLIRELSAKGVSIIYISHALDDVLALCHHVAVLRDGAIIGQSPVAEMTKERMISMMVGRKLEQLFPWTPKQPGDVLLEVEGLSRGTTTRDVSLKLRAGEIVGMFGLMGAGRSELVRAVYGVDPFDAGRILFRGTPVRRPEPGWWVEHGVAYITENRREEGLLMPKTVKENLVLASLWRMGLRFGAVDTRREERESEEAITRLRVKTYDKARQPVRMLSGGNQQKVVIGKWLLTHPTVFLVDEPTRGVDVGAKFEIYSHLNALAAEGSAILFVSSEMEELMGVCDRVLVMARGRITGELQRSEFSQRRLLELAIGGGNAHSADQ
jgi:ABC-type sugar transport system ATPase subunit